MDRSFLRALRKWDQLLALRQHTVGRSLDAWPHRLSHSQAYHAARLKADMLLRQLAPKDALAALEEAAIGEVGRQALDEAHFQMLEDGIYPVSRDQAWTVTVFVPFACWDDANPAAPAFQRQPQQDDAGYRIFVTQLMTLMAPFEERLRQARAITHLQLSCSPRGLLGLPELHQYGWPLNRPFGAWAVPDRIARMINPARDWLKVGLIPMELSASSPEGLGVIQDLLRDHLSQAQAHFNTTERQVGLPARREAGTYEADLLRYELFVHRIQLMSQAGRGEANFLIRHPADQPMAVDMEVQMVLPDPENPQQPQVHVRQLQLIVRSPADLARIQAPWATPTAGHMVSHWSVLSAT